jgi:hypothetical protein
MFGKTLVSLSLYLPQIPQDYSPYEGASQMVLRGISSSIIRKKNGKNHGQGKESSSRFSSVPPKKITLYYANTAF